MELGLLYRCSTFRVYAKYVNCFETGFCHYIDSSTITRYTGESIQSRRLRIFLYSASSVRIGNNAMLDFLVCIEPGYSNCFNSSDPDECNNGCCIQTLYLLGLA
jgi:hypothetical protein